MGSRASRRYRSAVRSVKAGADAVERGFGRIFDAVVLAHPIIRLRLLIMRVFGSNAMVAPSPYELIGAIERRACEGLVSWDRSGAGVQCPDRFAVQVPDSAWQAYYRHNTRAVCARIERAVHDRLLRKLGCESSPHVSIERTCALLDVELTVEASFFDPGPKGMAAGKDGSAGETTCMHEAVYTGNAGVDEGAVSVADDDAADTAVVGPAVDVLPFEAALDAVAQAAGPAKTPVATGGPHLAVAWGRQRYSVADGFTIGVRRGDGRDAADIVLPYMQGFFLVSRRHGRFAFDAQTGSWSFEQLGANGSMLVRAGEDPLWLKQGDAAVLRDGDGLVLAGARRRITVLLEQDERTALSGVA